MLLKLTSKLSKVSESIENKVKQTTNSVSSLVFAALLITGTGISTETKADQSPVYDSSEKISHHIVSGDTLYNISQRYGVEISEIQRINKLHGLTIHIGSNILIKKGNNINKSSNNEAGFIKTKYSEKKESNIEDDDIYKYYYITLNPARTYSGMHSVKSKGLDKIYVISPSDTPLFLGKVKIIGSEKYIKIRLLNDRNITGYVRLSAFDEDTIELINKLIVELPEIFESSYEKKARKNTANQIIKTEEKIERKNTTKTISEVNYILEKSLDLIVKYEGFTQVAKWDRTHYSRGYGTKAPYAGAKITKKDAKKELHNKVKDIIEHVSTNFPHTNINQKISLVSFFYNNGTSKKGKTIFLHKLENMGKKVSAYSVADTMGEFITSGGKKLRGLERRRNEEVALFLSGSNNF